VTEQTLNGGRYELERFPLPGGAMGQVWLGRDTKLDRDVVVKFIRLPRGTEEGDQIRRRFKRESRITARLEHPGVPAIHDVGVDEGRPFIVMQRVRGINVDDLIAEHGPLPIGWAAAIAAQAAAVLAVAHHASLVHRDLKPGNLILEPYGGVKVLDFGLAVAPEATGFSRITRTGDHLGTPAYMAPEQVESNVSGPAADLYALGCTLHEMISGVAVFSGSSFQVMTRQVETPPTPLRALRPETPDGLEALVLELLEKKPPDRPENAATVCRRLTPFIAGLGPLPGVIDPPGADAGARIYSAILTRIFAEAGWGDA
jgi:serine/threonine protein kinase